MTCQRPDAAAISCSDITRRFAAAVGVEDVCFQLTGGICALLGPNGAGKSTLLKLLAGLVKPDAGTVRIAGLKLDDNAFEVKQLIGVLPEELGVFDDLSILEHLQLVGPIYGLSAEETAIRANGLLQLLRLDRSRHTLIRDCSYGMRKKTGIALALLHNPQVVLLDEPFEGTDPASSFAIEETLREITRRGTTVLFTSHLLTLVERLADRVLLLHQGRIVLDARIDSLDRSLEAHYFEQVGSPSYQAPPWLGTLRGTGAAPQ